MISIKQAHSGANLNLGNLYLKAGRFEEAVEFHLVAADEAAGGPLQERVGALNNLGHAYRSDLYSVKRLMLPQNVLFFAFRCCCGCCARQGAP